MIGATGRVAAIGTIALALALTGCAQDPGTSTAVGKRQVADPTPTSALLPPTPLPITRERSRAGAQEFAKYWFSTLNYALSTGDIAPFRAASNPACGACIDAVTTIRTGYADGGRLQGGAYTVRSANTEEFGLDDQPLLTVFLDRSARSTISADGAVRDRIPAAGFVNCQITLEWVSSGWRTSSVAGELLPVS